MKFVKSELHVFAMFISVLISFPVLALVVTFTTYILASGNVLTAPVAFASMALFNGLRFPLMQMGQVIAAVGQCSVSISRLEVCLLKNVEEKKEGMKVAKSVLEKGAASKLADVGPSACADGKPAATPGSSAPERSRPCFFLGPAPPPPLTPPAR